MLLVLLDLSVAFDTIGHGILLDRLYEVEIGSLALSWLQSILKDCIQRVQLKEKVLAPWTLLYGLPQESTLFLILFNIYVKQYADDKTEILLLQGDL